MNPLHVNVDVETESSVPPKKAPPSPILALALIYPPPQTHPVGHLLSSSSSSVEQGASSSSEQQRLSWRDSIPLFLANAKSKLWRERRRYSVATTVVLVFLIITLASTAVLGPRVTKPNNNIEGSSQFIYVETYGSDVTGDGTQARPFATISRASFGLDGSTGALPGTTVRVGPGLYNLTSMIYTTASGVIDAPILYLSVVKWGARLHAAHEGEAIWLNRGNNVEIRGFRMDGGYRTGVWTEGSFVRIAQNLIEHVGSRYVCGAKGLLGEHAAGIFAPMPSVTGTDPPSLSPVQVPGGNIFEQNLITQVGSGSSQCSSSSNPSSAIYTQGANDLIVNNILFANTGNGIFLSCDAQNCRNPQVAVMFNLVANCTGVALVLSFTSNTQPTGAIANNIITHNSLALYSNQAVATSVAVLTNIVYANTQSCSNQPSSFACPAQKSASPGLSFNSLSPSLLGALSTGNEDDGIGLLLSEFAPKCSSSSLLKAGTSSATIDSLTSGLASRCAVAISVDFSGSPRPVAPVTIGPIAASAC